VISATNRSLEELAEGSQFRPDLFHRLKGALIRIPRLSERREDIPLLAAHFLRKYSIEDARQNVRISNEALAELMSYSFPGNIRELENAIRYALVLSRGEWIKVDNLPEELRRGSEFRPVFSVGKVRHNELIKALKAVRLSSSDGSMKEWHEAMKSIKIEDICRFLLESEGGEFSRQEFASYLSRSGRNDRNKGATAGRYLQVMRSNGILEHNGGKAGKARYRLSEVFIISD
jgi:DNA-binding NtrC family response regulator